MKDMDGLDVRAGDVIRWSYGIPFIVVLSDVFERKGHLFARHRGEHNGPKFCSLRNLNKWGYEFTREKRRAKRKA